MATQHFLTLFFFLLLSSQSLSITENQQEDTFDFVRPINRKLVGLNRKEKLSHFRFYLHDMISGENATSVEVVHSPQNLNSSTHFGLINVFDNPLTSGPQSSSKLVGRAQGLYASASHSELDFLLATNFAFVEGKYNGSSLTILGKDTVYHKVRELPVISGSGLFRFARGYAQVSTHWTDLKTGDAISEYNVYVFHY